MKISVVMGTCHGEKYIGEQLTSLFHQTLLPDEILIGDDSGDTKTLDAIDKVKDQYPRHLRIIRNPDRLGVVNNFRNLVKQASGDIIFFADQDDYWLPVKIEKMVDALKKHPEKLVTVCNSEAVDEKLTPKGYLLLDRTPAFYEFTLQLKHGGWKSFRDIFMQKYNFPGHNMAMRKEIRDLFLEMPEDYYSYHDHWLAQISSLAGKIFYIDEVLTLHRQHGNNTSGALKKPGNNHLAWLSLFFHSTGEIEQTRARLDPIMNIVRSAIFRHFFPEENLKRLNALEYYYQKRVELHQKKLVVRFIYVIPLLPHYFQYGLGFRSLLRDLIIK